MCCVLVMIDPALGHVSSKTSYSQISLVRWTLKEQNHGPIYHYFIHCACLLTEILTTLLGTVVVHWTASQQVNNGSCIRGMIHNKIHLVSTNFPWPSIALLC